MRLLLELGYKEEEQPPPLPAEEPPAEDPPAANGKSTAAAEDAEADPFDLDALAAAPAAAARDEQAASASAAAETENGRADGRWIAAWPLTMLCPAQFPHSCGAYSALLARVRQRCHRDPVRALRGSCRTNPC